MSMELLLGMIALFGMAAIGTPVGYAILVGCIVYLGVAGQDVAIAGTTMVQSVSLTAFCCWPCRSLSRPPTS